SKLSHQFPNVVNAANNGLDVEEAHKPNIHWKSDRALVTEVDSFGKTYVASEEYPASPHDTRESPDNRPTRRAGTGLRT
ncbi:hypothetical protein ACLBP5_30495, partial [Klebsiella pneumoniae]